jgi:hypothetical protein
MSDQEPIKIIIEEEETPLKADQGQSVPRKAASDAGRKAAAAAGVAAKKAWNSDTGRMAAKKLQEVSDRGIRYVGTRMADAAEEQAKQTAASVQERVRNTDWQEEARVGLASGLKWLSAQVSDLANRTGSGEPQEKSPADLNQPGSESE